MKKLIFSMLVLTLCIFTLAACSQNVPEGTTPPVSDTSGQQPSGDEQKPPLKVALDAAYRPMEWEENGKIVGFDADLIKAIAEEMGREVELLNIGWDDIFDKLHTGEYDVIISGVSINDERKQSMLFSDSYFESSPTILTRESANIKSASDLSKKKVAVQKDTTADEIISKNIAGVKVERFDSAELALNSFANKEVDAVIIDAPVLLDFAKQKNDPEYEVVKDADTFPKEDFGIAVNLGGEELISEINSALQKLRANGEYQRIYDEYFRTE